MLASLGFGRIESEDDAESNSLASGTGLQIGTAENEAVRKHHGMSRFASFGDTSLYGVYGAAHEQIFDSDDAFHTVDTHINADVAINNAEKLLRLVVADRRLLLEDRADILPASIRLDKSLDEYDTFNVERTKDLVDSIISGKFVSAAKAAEADIDNISADVYVNQFTEASERVCRLSEKLLGPLKIERPRVEGVVNSSPARVITRTASMVPKFSRSFPNMSHGTPAPAPVAAAAHSGTMSISENTSTECTAVMDSAAPSLTPEEGSATLLSVDLAAKAAVVGPQQQTMMESIAEEVESPIL